MKKAMLVFLSVMFMTAVLFAADFSPTPMILTVPAEIEYQFDGTGLTIPFTLNGTPASLWLVINTRGQSSNIIDVRNGYLGWHYVNKIDTTVYISGRYQREPGQVSVVWDGKDEDGNVVAAGTYSYYLWGYDNITPRLLASEFFPVGFDWESQYTYLYELGEDGLPLARPMFVGSRSWHLDLDIDAAETTKPYLHHGMHFKWVLGGDPHNLNLLQTTDCAMYTKGTYNDKYNSTFSYGGPVFDPNNYSIFYHCCVNVPSKTNTMLKWTFVSDGQATLDEDWLGWDNLVWEDQGEMIGFWSQKPSCVTDRSYIYVNSPGLHQKEDEWNRFRCVSFDGEVIFDKAMHEWYMPDDPNPHGYINGSFHHMGSRTPYNWFLMAHTSCMHEMINTSRLVVDPDDETDMVMFSNSNGDYFLDAAWAPNLEPGWYCLADDKEVMMRNESIGIDRNGFNVIGIGYSGLDTFGLSTQDGTAIGYMAFGDESIADNRSVKSGGLLCDSGSSYDGFYWAGMFMEGLTQMGGDAAPQQRCANFVAFDSAGGVITNVPVIQPGVEDAQLAFAVNQNAPNPFNPTTSIFFTIPAAGNVTVDIYNVAGQKVDTLVNGMMNAGRHSVVWDATGFSNGVYFYTVKSGDISRTMKMTLLK